MGLFRRCTAASLWCRALLLGQSLAYWRLSISGWYFTQAHRSNIACKRMGPTTVRMSSFPSGRVSRHLRETTIHSNEPSLVLCSMEGHLNEAFFFMEQFASKIACLPEKL